jgi:hypothetical protein
MGERHLIELTGNLRHQDLSGVHRLYYTGNTNLALYFWLLGVTGGGRRVGDFGGETAAGGQ